MITIKGQTVVKNMVVGPNVVTNGQILYFDAADTNSLAKYPPLTTYWYNNSWLCRKSHNIIGSNGAGTNYQMRITIHKSYGGDSSSNVYLNNNIRNDFGDVRFTSSDGTTLLDYWIETGSLYSGISASFWVEVSENLDSDRIIYIYYNNSGATTTSNGNNTFILFDDFTGNTLDTSKWTKYNGTSPSFSNSLMTISATADPGKIIATGGPQDNNRSIVSRFKVTAGTSVDERAGVGVKTNTSDGYGYNYLFRDFTNLNNNQFLDDMVAWGNSYSTTWYKDTFYIFECFHDGTTLYGRSDYGSWRSQNGWTSRTGYASLNFGSYNGEGTVDWDWAAIRKCITTEPTHSSWGVEENISINWVDLTKNGNNGYFISGIVYNSDNMGNLVLDGTSYISINDKPELNLTGFTYSGWLLNSATSLNWNRILSKKDIYTDMDGYEICLETGSSKNMYISGVGSTFAVISTVDWINTGWHNLVVIFNDTIVSVYVDNIYKGQDNIVSVVSNNRPLFLGKINSEATTQWVGKMANISLYNRILSVSEINQNFNALRKRYGI